MTTEQTEQAAEVLTSIFKAYDVRGLCPEQLSAPLARRIGAAYARWCADNDGASKIAVGADMRPTSPELVDALAAGITSQGLTAVVLGLTATDQLYFASGWQKCPGIMVTASHNPAAYNGLKFCRAEAAPIGLDTGLAQVRDLAIADLPAVQAEGEIVELDSLAAYSDYLHSLVPLGAIRHLRVVIDSGNGMAGHTVPAVFASIPATVVPMYFELDGSFPNHPADPLNPANLVDLQHAVIAEGADLGLAFDGDADRCFVIDENGAPVSPSAITALIAEREIALAPGAGVVHNVISSASVAEVIAESGGVAYRTKVGHSNMKAEMARTGAVFGGEHSAHYYFKNFWGADTGMLAAMHVLAALGEQDQPLSQVVAKYDRYVASGEINSTVADAADRVQAVLTQLVPADARRDDLDGLTIEFADGAWFNLRSSNTEPLLRLNVEAASQERMEQIRDDALAVIRQSG